MNRMRLLVLLAIAMLSFFALFLGTLEKRGKEKATAAVERCEKDAGDHAAPSGTDGALRLIVMTQIVLFLAAAKVAFREDANEDVRKGEMAPVSQIQKYWKRRK